MWQPLTKSWYSRPKSGLVEDKNSGWKITLTRSERLLNSWQRLKAIMMGSVASLTMLCVVIGGNRDAPWQHYIKLFCHNRRWCNKMCNLWILLPTNLNSWVWLNNDRHSLPELPQVQFPVTDTVFVCKREGLNKGKRNDQAIKIEP